MESLQNSFHIEYSDSTSDNNHTLLHHHASHEIIFIKEGSPPPRFTIEGKEYAPEKNCLLFISNFENHRHHLATEQYKRYFMLMDNDFLKNCYMDNKLLSIFMNRPRDYCHMIRLSSEQASLVEGFFEKILNEYDGNRVYRNNMLKMDVCELLILLYRINSTSFYDYSEDAYAKIVIEVQNYLNNHFREAVTLRDTAVLFGADMNYLSKKFKEIIGFSFKHYLLNLRVSHVKFLLTTTNKSVAAISEECGFNDLANFNKTFKRIECLSPLQYRKQFKK